MKRKGFILMEVLLALLLLSALAAAVFPILGQTAGAMAFYGPAEAGSERSRFCCRFHDREDTEQSQGKRGADERERVQVRSVYMGEGWQG